MKLDELYSEIIKDHNISRHNKRELESPSLTIPGRNSSCGDEIELSLRIEHGRIIDGAYCGIGCAISQASASIMIDLVKGKTTEEARMLCGIFLRMVRGDEPEGEDKKLLGEAMAFTNVANMPARVKCATMPWYTLERAVKINIILNRN